MDIHYIKIYLPVIIFVENGEKKKLTLAIIFEVVVKLYEIC